jgi:hypothetical protein
MPRRGQPSDEPWSAPESGTVREPVEDVENSPANPRASDEKSTDPNRGPKDDPSSGSEEK